MADRRLGRHTQPDPDPVEDPRLAALVAEVRACRLCADLPLGPRPVLRVARAARVLIVGQAPGTKVHLTGLPWNDASGDRLRAWLGTDRATFYDRRNFAVLPVGLCYPGANPKGGDNPPRPVCAPLWHPRVRPALTDVRLTLLVGSYAQAHYLLDARARTMTETVADWSRHLPAGLFPLPHPSWRNTGWLKRHPWFEAALLPSLRSAVAAALARPTGLGAP